MLLFICLYLIEYIKSISFLEHKRRVNRVNRKKIKAHVEVEEWKKVTKIEIVMKESKHKCIFTLNYSFLYICILLKRNYYCKYLNYTS